MGLAEIPKYYEMESEVMTSSRKTRSPYEAWGHSIIFKIFDLVLFLSKGNAGTKNWAEIERQPEFWTLNFFCQIQDHMTRYSSKNTNNIDMPVFIDMCVFACVHIYVYVFAYVVYWTKFFSHYGNVWKYIFSLCVSFNLNVHSVLSDRFLCSNFFMYQLSKTVWRITDIIFLYRRISCFK